MAKKKASRPMGGLVVAALVAAAWTVCGSAGGTRPAERPTKPPKGGEVVIRVTRGAEVRGRVVDHTGKPAAGAKVFLCSRVQRMLVIRDRKPAVYFRGSRATCGADGRFVLAGAAATHVAVSTRSLDCWLSKIPTPGKDVLIKLPAPARVVVHFDIPGAAGRFRFELKAWDMPEWKGLVGTSQLHDVANPGKLAIEGLTPGVYDVCRLVMVRLGSMARGGLCDRRDVTLEPGKTTEIRFVRKPGQRLGGHVVGLQTAGVQIDSGAAIHVKPAGATADLWGERKLPLFDAVGCGLDGAFQTALLEPGRYTIVAQAYEVPDRRGPFTTGIRRPSLVGTAEVTVPANGRAPHVLVLMGTPDRKRKSGTKPTPLPAKPAEKLRRLWRDLGAADRAAANKTIAAMAAMGDAAVAFLADRLEPAPAKPAQVEKLLADLDSDTFAVRTKAHAELSRLGRAAIPAMRRTLKKRQLSAEVRTHVNKLLADLARPLPADRARRMERVVLVLVRINTPKARGMLARLAKNEPQDHVRALARAILAARSK